MDPYTNWTSKRKETIKRLREVARDLRKHGGNAKLASAVGGGAGIAAGVGAAVLYFCTPFTGGASAIPAAALTGIAVAGGVTSLGSAVVNYFIERGLLNGVQDVINEDKAALEKLKEFVQKVQEQLYKAPKAACGGVSATTFVVLQANKVSRIANTLRLSERAVASLANLGRSARFAGHALTFVALPLDVVFFVRDIIDLVKGNISQAADRVDSFANDLQKEYSEIDQQANIVSPQK